MRISTFLIIALISLKTIDEVNGQCMDLVQQYYQCKYLKMKKTEKFWGEVYEPDPSIANNVLNESFYVGKPVNLNKMNFDKAMTLFETIYLESDNCTQSKNEFCECVNLGHIDQHGNYSIYFRNRTNFVNAKKVIKSFVDKFKPKLLSFGDLQYHWNFYQFSTLNLTTLIHFCMEYDYSENRLQYYNTTYSCFGYDNLMVTYSCEWDLHVVNKTLLISKNYTNTQMEQQLVCHLLKISDCLEEEQRFYALSTWAIHVPRLNWSGKNLNNFLDSLLKRAKKYRDKPTFENVFMNTQDNHLSVTSLNKGWQYIELNSSNFSGNFLTSPQLTIDCEWKRVNRMIFMSWMNFSFIYDSTRSFNLSMNMSFLTPVYNTPMSNGTIIKDKLGENWIQIFWHAMEWEQWGYFDIYDFYSKIHVVLSKSKLNLYASSSLLKKASGFLVKGFNKSIPHLIVKKKRPKNS